MWAKFSSALKSTTTRNSNNNHVQEESSSPVSVQVNDSHARGQTPSMGRSQAEVMAYLLEQHPNLSVFHNNSDSRAAAAAASQPHPPPVPPLPQSQPSPPPSPSKRSLFKRSNKDSDSIRTTSNSLKLLPKKIRGSLPFGNGAYFV